MVSEEAVLILTGAVFPAVRVRRCDPSVRRNDYERAIKSWLDCSPFNLLIYADGNRGHIVTPEMSEYARQKCKILLGRSYDFSGVAVKYGKGRSEALILESVVEEFRPSSFTKVTGRLFVRNYNQLALNLAPTLFNRSAPGHADTRFFKTTLDFFMRKLVPAHPLIVDPKRISNQPTLSEESGRDIWLDEDNRRVPQESIQRSGSNRTVCLYGRSSVQSGENEQVDGRLKKRGREQGRVMQAKQRSRIGY